MSRGGARGPASSRGGRRRDLELEAGTSAHYEDPAYYQATYLRRTEDVAFYVERARRCGGAVLEVGCGNGRITLPVARAGVSITGVDLSAPMLADLRVRLRAEPAEVRARVALRRADMRTMRVPATVTSGGALEGAPVQATRRFRAVFCPFNTLLHLYERVDVERFLARVKAHLEPRGRLVLDVSIPEPEELARDPGKPHRVPPFKYPGVGRVRYAERFDYDRLRQILFVGMEFEPVDGRPPFATPLAHRQFFPRELEALLHYNGFAIEEEVGDFAGPPTQTTATLALVCRVRR